MCLKVFYGNKNILYKSSLVLAIILTLFFGQAIINSIKNYVTEDFLNLVIEFASPVLDTTNQYEKLAGVFGFKPQKIIKNDEVSADEINVEERAIEASVVADYNSAKGIEVKNNTDYFVDTENLINEDLGFKISKNKPSVLIVHTHTSEAYLKTKDEDYIQSDNKRTQDPNYNVIRVGEEFKKALESKGVVAIHNKTVHDYPSYNGSYLNTLKTIEKELSETPSIKIVIDIHRDAVETDETVYKFSSEIEGENSAQVMIVTGSDANGIENPLWKENYKFALKYQRRMNLLYPGLTRPLSLVRERYNTHLTTGSIILEIGTTGNTLKEAIVGAKYAGLALGDMLQFILE